MTAAQVMLSICWPLLPTGASSSSEAMRVSVDNVDRPEGETYITELHTPLANDQAGYFWGSIPAEDAVEVSRPTVQWLAWMWPGNMCWLYMSLLLPEWDTRLTRQLWCTDDRRLLYA